MPIYEFVCKAGHTTSELMSFAAAEGVIAIPCEVCNEPAKRVASVPLRAKVVSDEKSVASKKYNEWMNSPETRKKLDSGDYIDVPVSQAFDGRPGDSLSQETTQILRDAEKEGSLL